MPARGVILGWAEAGSRRQREGRKGGRGIGLRGETNASGGRRIMSSTALIWRGRDILQFIRAGKLPARTAVLRKAKEADSQANRE